MAAELVAEVWELDLPVTERLVALWLAQAADSLTRLAAPSIAEVTARTRLSERAVRYAVRELERAGVLRMRLRRRATPEYTFLPRGAPDAPQESRGAPDAPLEASRGAPDAPLELKRGTTCTPWPPSSLSPPDPLSLSRESRTEDPNSDPNPDPSSFKLSIQEREGVWGGERQNEQATFLQFWSAYPSKVAKPKALLAWRHVEGPRHLEAIVADRKSVV